MQRFELFPAERMDIDFPWVLWAVGWLAVIKAFIWLAYEPVLPQALLRVMGVKLLLAAAPLVVCGIGLWNRRRWAVWGVAALALANLLFLWFYPRSFQAYLVESEINAVAMVLSAVMLLCEGPLGDALILLALPFLFKTTRLPSVRTA
ncbi:MAG: hypothetical protein MUD16_10380 [Desulfobacterales bacterium]|jgi:hypothetical protein|nr:hypothetical protein [Desulfobacterales bacterium]